MKTFEKVATMLLSLSLCFSAVACNPENNVNSPNSGGSSNNEDPKEQVGVSLANAIIGQLEEANTLVINFSMERTETIDYKVETEDTQDDSSTELNEIVFTVAKTENGYDFKADITQTVSSENGTPVVTKDAEYMIDDVSYSYDDDYDAFLYSPYYYTNETDLSMFNDFFTDDETAQLKAAFADVLGTVYDFDSKNISLGVDLKDDANSLIDYVSGLDITTKTVKGVINDVLASIDETLTVDSILAEIEAVSHETVGDALDAIDAFLTENADTTLQGLKDDLMADERIVGVLKSMNPELTDENIQQIKDFVIDEELASQEEMLLDEVIFNLFAPLIIGEFDPKTDTYENMLASIQDPDVAAQGIVNFTTLITKSFMGELFNATLEQAIEDEDAAMELAYTIEMMKGVDMTELKATADVAFDNYFAIDALELYMGFAYEIANEEFTMNSAMRFNCNVETISTDVTAITLPEDTKVFFEFWLNSVSLDNNSGVTLYQPNYNLETGFETAKGYFRFNDNIFVYFSYNPPISATNTWEITITSIEKNKTYYYFNEDLSTLLNGDLTYSLTFDFEESSDYITDFVLPEEIANS